MNLVLIQATNLSSSLYGWLRDEAERFYPAGFIHDVGAGRVLEFNRIFSTKRGFNFYHATEQQSGSKPTPWAGYSDTAASLLALAQSQVAQDAPIVLISCECDFSRSGEFRGAKLSPVSVSRDSEANANALMQKWAAATQSEIPILALVLFQSDAELLADSLYKRATPVQIEGLSDFNLSKYIGKQRQCPMLVSVQADDLPMLAAKLGINPQAFELPQAGRDGGTQRTSSADAYAQSSSSSNSRSSGVTPLPRLQLPEAQYDRAWYINRPLEERESLEKLNAPGMPVILWGPEKFGKTWLQSFLRDAIREQDPEATIVPISLWSFDKASLSSLENFIQAIGIQITDAIGAPEQWFAETFGGFGSPNLKLTRLMEKRILPAVPSRLVLAIDRADAVYGAPFQDDFFSLLRCWAEDYREPWPRLRLLLAVSTTPAELSQRITVSPFNLGGNPVQMRDLSPTQVHAIAQLHGVAWRDGEIERAMSLVGGHPYLIRLLIHKVASEGIPLDGLLDEQHPAGSVFDHYLERCRSHLRKEPSLHEAFRRLAKGQVGPADAPALPKLQSMGLVVPTKREHQLRYPLYQRLV